jgi:hypothetical protein
MDKMNRKVWKIKCLKLWKSTCRLHPNIYFNEALNQCKNGEQIIGDILDEKELMNNLFSNAIPNNIFGLTAESYESFLLERRKLMARKIKEYYSSL